MEYLNRIGESVDFIKKFLNGRIEAELGIILGSGLGGLGEKIEDAIEISYEEIPNFPLSTVEGHKGQLIFGKLGNKNIVAMQGRFHYYEGYKLPEVVFPIRVLIGLGIKNLIVTNAAGGIDLDFTPGDLMIINDHINFTGQNPLIGKNYSELGQRFVDMSCPYSRQLIELAKNAGAKLDIKLKEGTYIWFTGPSYETPAEIKLSRVLGASAVGMSTVPEVIVAAHEGIPVLGISCITNMAAGILEEALEHEKVIETSIMVRDKFERLIIKILESMPERS